MHLNAVVVRRVYTASKGIIHQFVTKQREEISILTVREWL